MITGVKDDGNSWSCEVTSHNGKQVKSYLTPMCLACEFVGELSARDQCESLRTENFLQNKLAKAILLLDTVLPVGIVYLLYFQ